MKFSHNGIREMEFVSLDGGEYSIYNVDGLMDTAYTRI